MVAHCPFLCFQNLWKCYFTCFFVELTIPDANNFAEKPFSPFLSCLAMVIPTFHFTRGYDVSKQKLPRLEAVLIWQKASTKEEKYSKQIRML